MRSFNVYYIGLISSNMCCATNTYFDSVEKERDAFCSPFFAHKICRFVATACSCFYFWCLVCLCLPFSIFFSYFGFSFVCFVRTQAHVNSYTERKESGNCDDNNIILSNVHIHIDYKKKTEPVPAIPKFVGSASCREHEHEHHICVTNFFLDKTARG